MRKPLKGAFAFMEEVLKTLSTRDAQLQHAGTCGVAFEIEGNVTPQTFSAVAALLKGDYAWMIVGYSFGPAEKVIMHVVDCPGGSPRRPIMRKSRGRKNPKNRRSG